MPFKHVGALEMLVMLARQAKEGQRALDGLLHPTRQSRIAARPFGQPCGEIGLGLGEIAPVIRASASPAGSRRRAFSAGDRARS